MSAVMALLGALTGFGLLGVVIGLRTDRMSLSRLVAELEAAEGLALEEVESGVTATARHPLLTSLGERVDELAARSGHRLVRTEDIEVLEREPAVVYASLGLATVVLAVLAGLFAAALRLLGVAIPGVGLLVAATCGGLAGLALAVVDLRRAATRAREAFVRALGVWLELVALAQAGGMGVESALQASSEVADDPGFVRLRSALARAEVTGAAPWDGLAALGGLIGVTELEELSSTLRLAGSEGARVRTTIMAKAASLRRHQIADAEARAKATNERLFLPSILLMLAFMLFLTYPAAARLAHVF